eukprot:SAG11_NODE_24915_length_366_cov_0.756554_1_plen_61_part_01
MEAKRRRWQAQQRARVESQGGGHAGGNGGAFPLCSQSSQDAPEMCEDCRERLPQYGMLHDA